MSSRSDVPGSPPSSSCVATGAPVAELSRLALDCVEDGLWEWSAARGGVFIDGHAGRLLGCSEGAQCLSLDALRRLCEPEALPDIERGLREHLEGVTPRLSLEVRLRREGGAGRWVLCRGRVVARDAQGLPVRLVGTLMDISGSKRHEERLGALQVFPDLLFRMSSDGTYLDVRYNDPDEVVGPPESLIGRNIRDLPVPQHLIDGTLEYVPRVIREGTLMVYEYELEMPRGRQCYETRIIRSGEDEATAIVRNVTQRKRAEEALRRSKAELEQLLEQLRETQQRLILREKMAALGMLVAGIAHELRNPLNFIINFAQVAQAQATELSTDVHSLQGSPERERLDSFKELLEEQNKVVSLIEEHGKRASGIVNGMLLHSRNLPREKRTSTDINRLVSESVRLVLDSLRTRAAIIPELEETYTALPCTEQVAAEELSRVIINLLENACYSTGKKCQQLGGDYVPRVTVSTDIHPRAWELRIRDNGLGIAEEHLDKIFQPFFTTKPPGEGTGLGLSICYDIVVHSYKGEFRVVAEEGEFAEFTIHLPRSQTAA